MIRRYAENGRLKQLTYPGNLTIDYEPNALGEPRRVGNYATAIKYHPNGALASFTYGNGITHTMVPNTRGLPLQVIDNGVLNDVYTYDKNGNPETITDVQEGVATRAMTYDDLDRLKTVTAPQMWGRASYEYDALDNLTTTSISGGPTARNTTHIYNPNTNRLDRISGPAGYNLSYLYDNYGNVKQRGSQQFVFDLGNRMRAAPGKGTYVYDGLGHRVSVVGTDGVNRVQVYSQDGRLMYAGSTSGPQAAGTKYIYLDRHILAEVGAGGSAQYDHTDGLGSPVARTDGSRAVLSRTRYEPFGATAAGATGAIGFAGHVNAADLGLVYMVARYYDPVAGRFSSIDPVTTDANTGSSFNRYAYANNSPYKYIDPDGRQADEKFVEQHRKDMEAGNGAVYKPLMPMAVGVTAGMAVVPAIAAAAIAASPTAIAVTGSAGAKAAGPISNAVKELSKQEMKSIRSLEKQIEKHEQKIADFKANPSVRPGMENQSPQTIAAQQASRISGLEKEIQTFKNNIEKIRGQ